MPRDVLMVTSQSPFDPASGAARCDRSVMELLAEAGFGARVLGTTSSERDKPIDHSVYLAELGILPAVDPPADAAGRPVYRFVHRGIEYTLLDTGEHRLTNWMPHHDAQFDALLTEQLERRAPDIYFGYGGLQSEQRRRRLARGRGAITVMYLHNWGYLHPRAFDDIDAVIACGDFVAQRYRDKIGLESTVLPMQVDAEDCIPPEDQRRPRMVTFINPSAEKGVVLMARICEDICRKRRDIPFMVINARMSADNLVKAGLNGGFDLRRHPSIYFSPGVPKPWMFFAATRVLVLPSVWDEPASRTVAEAMVCGTPTIISDRGGMRGTARGGAIVLPIPPRITCESNVPITTEEAQPWVEAIEALYDDPAFYEEWRRRAAAAGGAYARPVVRSSIAGYFNSVKRKA